MSIETKFNYCGFDSRSDLGLMVVDIKRPILAETTEQTTTIPGMFGTIYEGLSFGAKVFTIDVLLEASSERDRVLKLRELANLFTQTGDGDEYPLIFSDESEVVWYVHPVDVSEPQRVAPADNSVLFSIKFSSSEGVALGEKVEQILTKQTTVITPGGNTTTYPIFTVVPTAETTSIAIASDDESYIYLGAGFDQENQDKPINKQPRILNDACNTLASWTKLTAANLTFNIENGVISSDSDMRTTGQALRVALKDNEDYFGANVSKKWHGPARQQWFSKALKDWKVEAHLYLRKGYARARNKIELYLLDSEGRRVGKIMLKDAENSYEVLASAQIGYDSNGVAKSVYNSNNDSSVKRTKNGSNAKKTIKYKETVKVTTGKGKTKKATTKVVSKTMALPQDLDENTFTGFYGVCTFQKVGNKYSATFQKCLSNGKPTGKKWSGTYTDSTNKFGDEIAGVAVYIGKYDITEDSKGVKYKANPAALTDIKVYEILGDTVEIVARAGDEIVINCEENKVYRNGSLFLENLYIGSEFLTMSGGVPRSFTVSPEPGSGASWWLDYSPRYN
ncbi:distal tail protein Dit [Peribacillus sp. TH24]|uniref:distal tail protein Dit n=1 Tax=Peribacillus sp. TH24 TaxID=2798483 RepID=UPI001911C9E0|nr:distal tail protein Dit [Peribacillus sp. TH24]MBK5446070.1 phage tail family protein [Peribacillus sp. TH24]